MEDGLSWTCTYVLCKSMKLQQSPGFRSSICKLLRGYMRNALMCSKHIWILLMFTIFSPNKIYFSFLFFTQLASGILLHHSSYTLIIAKRPRSDQVKIHTLEMIPKGMTLMKYLFIDFFQQKEEENPGEHLDHPNTSLSFWSWIQGPSHQYFFYLKTPWRCFPFLEE